MPGKCLHAPEKGIVAAGKKPKNPKTGKKPKSHIGIKELRNMATTITKPEKKVSSQAIEQKYTPEATTENKPKKSREEVTTLLREFLSKGDDWQRKGTSIPGIAIIKMPATKTKSASLGLELNPVVAGNPTKRRGMTFLSIEEIDAAVEALTDARSELIAECMVAVTGGKASMNKDSGMIDI